jgi:hypothetical protein
VHLHRSEPWRRFWNRRSFRALQSSSQQSWLDRVSALTLSFLDVMCAHLSFWPVNTRNIATTRQLLSDGFAPESSHCHHLHPAERSPLNIIAADVQLAEDCLDLALTTALNKEIAWYNDPVNAIHAAILSGNLPALETLILHIESNSSTIRYVFA